MVQAAIITGQFVVLVAVTGSLLNWRLGDHGADNSPFPLVHTPTPTASQSAGQRPFNRLPANPLALIISGQAIYHSNSGNITTVEGGDAIEINGKLIANQGSAVTFLLSTGQYVTANPETKVKLRYYRPSEGETGVLEPIISIILLVSSAPEVPPNRSPITTRGMS